MTRNEEIDQLSKAIMKAELLITEMQMKLFRIQKQLQPYMHEMIDNAEQFFSINMVENVAQITITEGVYLDAGQLNLVINYVKMKYKIENVEII